MKSLALIFVVVLLAFGCVGSGVMDNTGVTTSNEKMMNSAPTTVSYGGADTSQAIAKEGQITIKVPEGTLSDKFEEMKTKLKGESAEMSDVNYNEYGNRKQYSLTVKVQPSRFEKVNAILKEIGEVKELSVRLEDVTKQYVDLDTRIQNKEIELVRLQKLYNESNNVSDLLDVERELTRVETDLELLKSEKAALVSRVDLSTIVITLYEDKPASSQLTLSLDGLGMLFFGAVAAAISVLVLGAGFFIPIILVIAVLWFIYKATFGRKQTKPKAPEHDRIPPQR